MPNTLRRLRAALALLALTPSCGATDAADSGAEPSTPAEPVPLLDPSALTPVDADRDPLALHRPELVDCPPAAWGPEDSGFEIQTGVCNYAALDQPLPVVIEAGDVLEIVIWHDLLDSVEPATGHVAVWVGSAVIWEREVEIPSISGTIEVEKLVELTPPADARLGIHLHNHGFNSWKFVSMKLHPQ